MASESPPQLADSELKLAAGSSIPEIDKQIAWHREQIALHHVEVAKLEAKRNLLAPIFRLPNELLSRIFTFYAVESNTLFNLKWSRIMYVCRLWYNLAMSEQKLWSFVDVSWNKFERLFGQLKRSGAAPLTIKVYLYDPDHYFDPLLAQSTRIHSLAVAGEAKAVHELIAELPNNSFPILSDLSLAASYAQKELPAGFVQALPSSFFDGGLPCLRQLTLIGIAFPWRLVHNLETLVLSNCGDSDNVTPAVGDLLSMIRACPQLRTLSFERDPNSVLAAPLPPVSYAPVDLPRLVELRIREHVSACGALLNLLRFPPSTNLSILPYGISAGPDVKEILVPLHLHMRADSTRLPSLLKFDASRRESTGGITHLHISFFGETTPVNLALRQKRTDNLLALNSHPSTQGALRQILCEVIKAVPGEHITHLDGRQAKAMNTESWLAALELLPALETAYFFAHEGAVEFVRALSGIAITDPQYEAFPLVRRIEVTFLLPVQQASALNGEFLEALEGALISESRLEALDMLDPSSELVQYREVLERIFHLMDGTGIITRDGVVYNPVRASEERRMLEADLSD